MTEARQHARLETRNRLMPKSSAHLPNRRVAWLLAGLALTTGTCAAAEDVASRPLAFVGVRVFDGRAVVARTNVVIRDGLVDAIGERVQVPEGAAIFGGGDRTLMPGLIDAHTHVRPPETLRQALAFGVTTELEMAGDPAETRRLRERQRAGLDRDWADLRSAG